MPTHTAGAEKAYAQLMIALEDYVVGDAFLADSWRKRAESASLTSAAVSAAHRRAVREEYLVPLSFRVADGRRAKASIPSDAPSRKGGRVVIYSRTSKPLPHRPAPAEPGREREECHGQTDLLEVIGR